MPIPPDLPQPWPGRTWCAVCAASYKAARLAREPGVQLEHAVTRSVYPPLAHLGPLDLCWAHVTPLDGSTGQDGSVAA